MVAASFVVEAGSFWLANKWAGGSSVGVNVALSTTKAFVATVTATSDAAGAFSFVHQLSATPTVFLLPFPAAAASFALSAWYVTANVPALVTIAKVQATGSGNAGAQLIVVITP